MLMRLIPGVRIAAIAICGVIFCVPAAFAETLQSTTYRFEESAVGTGGVIDAASTNYRADNAAGALVVGNSSSTNYQIESGPVTPFDPVISFTVNSVSSLGAFSATVPTTATSTFTVSNYTTYGYIVQVTGGSPKNGAAYTIPAMTTTGPSTVGVGQFGINLVANTSPSSFGANPNNGQFGFGTVHSNYSTSNQYRYVDGEIIAQATKNSGVTTYTISYLINVPALAPGGIYTSDLTLIATGTY